VSRRTSGRPKTKRRILIPAKDWTPFHRKIFQEVLPGLTGHRTGIVFLILFDRAWHTTDCVVQACLADLGRWTGLDERTVSACLDELENKGLIVCTRHGKLRSRSRKWSWWVPLAELDLKVDAPWTPVPRFLVTKYLVRFPGAVLLPILLWRQHIGWDDDCYPGAEWIARQSGWSKRKVYLALQTMTDQKKWNDLRTGLPWPLEVFFRKREDGSLRRHFRVRAVRYSKKPRGYSVVMLEREFASFFDVKDQEVKLDGEA